MKLFRYAAALGAATAALIGFTALASAATTSTASLPGNDANLPCPIVTSFMKQGIANNKSEVARLQRFLKDTEGANVDVNGVYDQKTEDAVKAFQKKYADVVLTPWGATKASGIVYITTGKKINQLACAEAMTLNGKELSVITDYQSGIAMASNHASLPGQGSQDPTVTYTSAVAGPASVQPEAPDMQDAAAADSSFIGKFWFFLKNLF